MNEFPNVLESREPPDYRATIRRIGLLAGPVAGLILLVVLPYHYGNPAGETTPFTFSGRATLSMMAWMAIWWLTEAIDLPATALLPLATFPLLGIADVKATAAPYAHELIFLFMGGLLLASSMKRWGLDRRIALTTLRLVGSRPANMVAGFMLVTAILSAFVSNTATAAMMMPIALSVVGLTAAVGDSKSQANFATCLMLGIAYAASIGGVVTIIGTPPNVLLISFLRKSIAEPYRIDISFVRWLAIGVPVAAIFLPIIWIGLTRFLYPVARSGIPGGQEFIHRQFRALGRANRGERVTLVVFSATVLAWVSRPLLQEISWGFDGNVLHPLSGLSDTGIAMAGGLMLFLIPAGRDHGGFVMDWETAKHLPWGVLVLFGGGLSLAAAVQNNGVGEFIASHTRMLDGIPGWVVIAVICGGIVFLTELTSNTATTATLLPVLAAMAPGLHVHPLLLVVPAAICASFAFMLPVATPPNAIVYSTGQVRMDQMVRAGFWFNLVGIVLITLLTEWIIRPVLGIY